MSRFQKGDKVINTSTNEKGFVIEVYPPRRGRQLYKVKYDFRENDENSEYLEPDVDLTDPFERCKLNYYGQYTEYLKGNTAFKIQNSNNNTISSLKASRTLFKAYQFKPLLKFLNADNRRLLIADEVGLGKTIEAGHIMLEMKARGELKNALVVCPVSLRDKWAKELTDKFGLDFFPVKDKSELIHEFGLHNGHVHAVVNYDKMREGSDILDLIIEKNIKFSIIICDESHKLRNSTTQLYHGMDKLLAFADCAVFMSATPIMIDEDNLYNQLHLLDPYNYDNPQIFRNRLQLNKPFLRALSQLNEGAPLSRIASELESAEVVTTTTINDIETHQISKVSDTFSDWPIYKNIIRNLHSGNDTHALRAQLQFDLSEMNPMNTVFSRTRKREVTQDMTQAERNPHTARVPLSAIEQEAYDETVEAYLEDHGGIYDEYGRVQSGGLGMVTVRRQLASSIWASKMHDSDLDAGINDYSDMPDSKFDELLNVLQTVFSHGNKKIIVFAIFKKTLKYLQLRLSEAGYKSVVIYGDSKIDKTQMLHQFQFDDTIQVLLSSEVGSEGLDMQFCNSLVNYDLPWNPMVVEQRIGRIDRFGQQSKKVNIYNILVQQSILEEIYSRLLDRIGIFRSSIGDLEAILDLELERDGRKETIKDSLKNLERDFYSDKLTEEEVRKKEAEIAQAIENERLNLEKIEEGLTNALTNDSYFRDEINKIVNNNAYVTSAELFMFVKQLIKEQLPTCELEKSNIPDTWNIVLPKNDPKVLRRFLQKYMPSDADGEALFARFLAKHDEETQILITFDQTLAFTNKSIEYINIYHPIIRAAVKAFAATEDKDLNTFFFQMPLESLPAGLQRGRYMLAIYKISVSRLLYGNTVTSDSLYPILYDIERNQIIDNHDIAEKFMGCAQVNGSYAPLEDNMRLDSEQVEDLRYDFKDCINLYVNAHRKDLQDRSENARKMNMRTSVEYYDARIKSLEASLRNQEEQREFAIDIDDQKAIRQAEGAIRLMKANIKEMYNKKEAELERINHDDQLSVIESISSINLVNII